MPQALDLATLAPRQGVSKSASSRRPEPREPADDFGKVLKRQTRRAEPQARTEKPEAPKPREEPAEAEASEEAKPTDESKPAAKASKKTKRDADETQSSEETESVEGEAVEKETGEAATALPVIAIAGENLDEHASEGSETTETPETEALKNESNPDAVTAQLAMHAPTPIQAQESTIVDIDGGDGEPLAQVQQALTTTDPAAKPLDPNALTKAAAPADTGEDAQMGAPIKLPTESANDNTDADLPEFTSAPAASAADDVAVPVEGAEAGKEFAQVLQTAQQPATQTPAAAPTVAAAPAAAAAAPERNFADDNVDRVVSSIKTELLPTGGTMKIRLDPEHLGQMQIDVTMDDGVLTASFETSNSEATRLLSHSLQQLKTALETTGVSVERIQVKQAAPAEQASSNQQGEGERQQQNPEDHPARQEQQRREMLQRMWAKLGVGSDPLDLVA